MRDFTISGYDCDEIDRKLILLTQNGLEVTSRPYLRIAQALGISETEVVNRLQKMAAVGFIRKNAIATNHYKLGFTFNAMTVWDIQDENLKNMGEAFRQLGFISHCYERPRMLPLWSYNLFAMIHGTNEKEIEEKIALMKNAIEHKFKKMDILLSTEILKKTGIRLKDGKDV